MTYARIPNFSQPVPARSDSPRTGRRRLSAEGRFLNLPNEPVPGEIEPWQAVAPVRPDTAHSRSLRFPETAIETPPDAAAELTADRSAIHIEPLRWGGKGNVVALAGSTFIDLSAAAGSALIALARRS